jgi:sterol desaturase/sphingolipid hydroxylase (fatty acid hydroxylase superfamily)
MSSKRPQMPRIRLFQSDRLERLTTVSPWAFVLMWTIVLSVAGIYAGWEDAPLAVSLSWFFCGLLVWSLFEYAMHRFMFHLKLQSGFGQFVVFMLHGNHHANPSDRERNLMPPIISVPISTLVWCLATVLVGSAGTLVFLGFMIGYVTYDGLHFACHQFPMRSGIMQRWQRHHLLHHYTREEGNFAITAIFWDRVFGSAVSEKAR